MKDVSNFTRIFIATAPADFRKHAHGLVTVAKETLAEQPFDAKALFVFTNKRKSAIKMVYWDLTGFAMWWKILEKDRFRSIRFALDFSICNRHSLLLMLSKQFLLTPRSIRHSLTPGLASSMFDSTSVKLFSDTDEKLSFARQLAISFPKCSFSQGMKEKINTILPVIYENPKDALESINEFMTTSPLSPAQTEESMSPQPMKSAQSLAESCWLGTSIGISGSSGHLKVSWDPSE